VPDTCEYHCFTLTVNKGLIANRISANDTIKTAVFILGEFYVNMIKFVCPEVERYNGCTYDENWLVGCVPIKFE